jgi:two-component system, NarL family, uhpT operon response regulator UhpA
VAELTPRERQVCELVARGLSVKRVARRLDLSPSTVKVHVRNAAAKLPGEGPPRHRIVVHVLRSEG